MNSEETITLLKALISVPSISQKEEQSAEILEDFLKKKGVHTQRKHHNIWATNKHFDDTKPTILLNSHHDTVQPNAGYTNDPFEPIIEEGKLYGLGSNDAGGCLVSLIATFLHFYERKDLTHNVILLCSAEEEISGPKGVSAVLPSLGDISWGIVGEPTQLQMAIAEKGLMVLDVVVNGEAGHAARDEGINAIYQAWEDVEWFKNNSYDQISDWLGAVKMTVTQITAGQQHNVVPASCHFVVDVRSTDVCSNEELLAWIKTKVKGTVKARSTRLNPSFIAHDHPLIEADEAMGLSKYGSPTLSDQALMPFPTLKMGPGDSARSHMADEYIYLTELEQGAAQYIKILEKVIIK